MSSHPRVSRRSSPVQRAVQFGAALALGVGLVGVVSVPAYALDYVVSTDAELRNAITTAVDTDTITFGGTFAVSDGDLPVLDNAVTINGNGYTLLLNGTASLRIENTNVTINNLYVSGASTANLEFVNAGGAINSVALSGSGGVGLSFTSTIMERHLAVSNSAVTINAGAGFSITHGNASTVTVQGGTITGNGAGILADVSQAGALTVNGTSISSNTNEGVHITNLSDGAVLSLDTVHVALNGSEGLRFSSALGLSNTTITNSTISGNPGGGMEFTQLINGARVTVSGTNILSRIQPNNTLGVSDPGLEPLADNDGPTLTHALLGTSPARDAGNPSFGTDPSVDQRGEARIQNGRIDIGAYEYEPQLASTGSDVAPLLLGAGMLLLLGLALTTGVTVARRQRAHGSTV